MRKLIFILIALISFSQAQTIQYIGGPTTTVISRGNFRADSIFYLPKRTKTPTDTAAFRYQISDSSLYYWTGYQWMKVGNNQDTASMLSNYVRGSGTTNYFPKFNSTRSIVDSKLYESNLNLLFNTTTPYVTTSGISTIENNGTSAALYVLKTLDTARAYVSFGGANTMDINNLRAGDIRFYTNATLRGRFQTDGTFRLNSLTGTGNRIVVADDNGVLSATSSATGLVDTTVLSTRAYRQKGDDSLGAIIATKGSGTVTSVATGYGLSGGTITTTGTLIADTALVASRLRLGKVADSLSLVKQNVLTNPVTGTGTTNYVPKFTGTSTIGNSQIFDNGTNVGINTASPSFKLDVNGTFNVRSNYAYFGSDANTSVYLGGFSTEGRIGVGGRSSFPTADLTFYTANGTNNFERMRITSSGELLINTTTDAGAYTLQNNGALYNTGSAVLAATSGGVSIGTTTITYPFQVVGTFAGLYSQNLMNLSNDAGAYTMARISNDNDVNTGILRNSSTNTAYGGAGSIGIYSLNANPIHFTNNNIVRLLINSSGETLFGTTTDAGNYRVQVSGNAYVSDRLSVATTSTNASIVSYNATNSIFSLLTNGEIYNREVGSSASNNTVEVHIRPYAGKSGYLTFTENAVADRWAIGIQNGNSGLRFLTGGALGTETIKFQTNGGIRYVPQSAAPTAEAGTVYYDSDDNKLKVYNGTTWVDLH